MTTMRAKFVVNGIVENKNPVSGVIDSITVRFNAVGGKSVASGYPVDGTDEDSTFSRWTPFAELTMSIQNPVLFDKFVIGQKFYSDFTEAVD